MEELTIEAGRAEAHYWRDLWRYRDLFYFLACQTYPNFHFFDEKGDYSLDRPVSGKPTKRPSIAPAGELLPAQSPPACSTPARSPSAWR
jgi:hypothetical protein